MRAWLPRLGLYVAAALVVLAPLPLGGTPGLARIGLGLLVAGGLAVMLVARPGPVPPERRFAWLVAITVAYALVAVVPLPMEVVEVVSPRLAAEARASLAAPGGPDELHEVERAFFAAASVERSPAAWRPLSADPDGTRSGLLRLVIALSAFVLTLLAVRSSRDRLIVLMALGGSAFLQAVYGMADHFAGHSGPISRMKSVVIDLPTGTFVNPNHYAAFLSLGLFAFAALLATPFDSDRVVPPTREQQRHRFAKLSLFATGATIVLLALGWTASRGALASAAVGVATLALAALAWRRRVRLAPLIALGVVSAALIAGAVFLRPPERTIAEFGQLRPGLEGRLDVWSITLGVAGEFPWTGTGIGAHRYVEPIFRTPELGRQMIHAHSDYLEWIAETGVPGVVLLLAWLVALGGAIFALVRRSSDRATSAAMSAGLLALALHVVAEFPLQLPGIAVPAAVLAGALIAPLRWGPSARGGVDTRGRRAWVLVAFSLMVLALLLAGWSAGSRVPPNSRGDVLSALGIPLDAGRARAWTRSRIESSAALARRGELDAEDASARIADALATLRKAATRTPMRGELQLALFEAAQVTAGTLPADRIPASYPELAGHYLRRAEELAPSSRARKLALVRLWLDAGARSEAHRISRDLLRLDPWLATEVYEVLGGEELDLGDLLAATPNTADAAMRLGRYLMRRRDLPGAELVLRRAFSRASDDRSLGIALAEVISRRGRQADALRVLSELPPGEDEEQKRRRLYLEARLHAENGHVEKVDELARSLVAMGEPTLGIARLRANARYAAQRPAEAIDVLKNALEAREAAPSPRVRLGALLHLGRLLEREGRFAEALVEYRRARAIDPDHPAVTRFFDQLEERTTK